MDESTVQLERHQRHSCRKRGEQPQQHVWVGISRRGTTPIVIFDGTMNADLYISILRSSFPFTHSTYPDSHRFNDSKHTFRTAQQFFAEEGINWWKTPPESSDTNPIENLWHELNKFMRHGAKPKTKSELISGIHCFWKTVDVQKCNKYISHLHKVIPQIIKLDGAATGY